MKGSYIAIKVKKQAYNNLKQIIVLNGLDVTVFFVISLICKFFKSDPSNPSL